ncbi:MAG: DUF1585 domain-containing protein, partial [Planctomycetota bacterium]
RDRYGKPKKHRVDASGALLSGQSFEDVGDLKKILAQNPRNLASAFLQTLAAYGLGRDLEVIDRRWVDEILDRCESEGYRTSDLIIEFIASDAFIRP